MRKNTFFKSLIIGANLLLFSCKGSDDAAFTNCGGDISIQYEMESINSAICVSKSDAKNLTPIENVYAMPRTDRVKIDVCYSKDGTYTMTIENIKPKGTAQYPEGTIGTTPNPTYSRAVISDGEVKIYDESGQLSSSEKDDENISENKRLVEIMLNYKPLDKSELDKLVPVMKANGYEAQESSDGKYIWWKQPAPNGGYTVSVIDRATSFLVGLQQYDAKNTKIAQTMINVENNDGKINLKGYLLAEDFVTPFSKTRMKRMYQSTFQNFSLSRK